MRAIRQMHNGSEDDGSGSSRKSNSSCRPSCAVPATATVRRRRRIIYATSRGSAATSEAAVGAVDADVGVTLGLHICEICVS